MKKYSDLNSPTDRAFRATDHLIDPPRLGRIVSELGVETIHEIIVGNYRIIYRIQEDEVQVVTVHHGARLLK